MPRVLFVSVLLASGPESIQLQYKYKNRICFLPEYLTDVHCVYPLNMDHKSIDRNRSSLILDGYTRQRTFIIAQPAKEIKTKPTIFLMSLHFYMNDWQ